MNPENKVTPSSCLGYYSHSLGQNSIPLHALQGKNLKKNKKHPVIFAVGMKQRHRCILFEHYSQADRCVNVLAWSYDPNLSTQDNKSYQSYSILNLCSTLSSNIPKRDMTDQQCTLGSIIYSLKLKF